MGDLLDEEVPAEFYLSEEKTQSVIRPVSYTHLDVYKRQAAGRSGTES